MFKNGIYNAGITISGPLINLITIPLATKALGPKAFGEASITLSIISYFTIISTLGLTIYGTREIAQTKNNKIQLEKVFSELLALSLIASCIGAVLYTAITILAIPTSTEIIVIGSLSLAINFLNIDWLFYAHENYKLITLGTLLSRLIGLILIYIYVKSPNDFSFYVGAILLSNTISLLFIFTQHKKFTQINLKNLELKKHLTAIFSFLGIRVFSSIYTTLDILIVGLIAGAFTAGLYTISIRVARIAITFVCSITAVAMPRASALYIKREGKNEYTLLIINTIIIAITLSTSASICMLLLSHPIIIFLGGDEYVMAGKTLKILSLMTPIVALSNFLGMQILYPMKKERTVATSIIIGSILCVTSMPSLLLFYEINGAAIAIILSELAILLVQAFSAKIILQDIYISNKQRLNRFLTLTIFCFFSSATLNFYIENSNASLSIGTTITITITILVLYIAGLFAIKEPLALEMLRKK